jgi:serine protein kinase
MILEKLQKDLMSEREEMMTVNEYLEEAKVNPSLYSTPWERLLKAIGEPKIVDTSLDQRLGRIFYNRKIKVYEAFNDFYGIEDVIENLVSFIKRASQGLEESKQILYFLGPVGSSKSSLAERLTDLIEQEPFYAIDGSPVFDHPLALFNKYAKELEEEYKIPAALTRKMIPSPWLLEKIKEIGIEGIRIRKMYPSKHKQIAVARVEPSDEMNQDTSVLVGKVDIRSLDKYSQNHPYSYSYSGGLCRANRGILNYVEMFKSPIKTLHPLLMATQEYQYTGTESIGVIPFEGMIVAHSNVSEWQKFRNDTKNEAFIDRIYLLRVPYCLRVSEEEKIYQKLIAYSSPEIKQAPLAPYTVKSLAEFSVLSRLKPVPQSPLELKMKVYDGENCKETDPGAKSLQEYRDLAGVDEGFDGLSTRFAFKALAKTYNFDPEEVAANPIHLFMVLKDMVVNEQLPKERQDFLVNIVDNYLVKEYLKYIEKELRAAYLDSFYEYGQNMFMRYLAFADAWLSKTDYRDPQTGQVFDLKELEKELEEIEKPAGIRNPKDFRSEIVHFALRHKAATHSDLIWTEYEKIKNVIEKRLFQATENILPVISFTGQLSEDMKKQHEDFLSRMIEKGYTDKQVRLIVEWYSRAVRTK